MAGQMKMYTFKKTVTNSSLLHVLVHQKVVILSILVTNMHLCLVLANNWGMNSYRAPHVLVYEIAKHHRDVIMFLSILNIIIVFCHPLFMLANNWGRGSVVQHYVTTTI